MPFVKNSCVRNLLSEHRIPEFTVIGRSANLCVCVVLKCTPESGHGRISH
nr:MAG TPA: Isochorismatase family [Caudoviricetes sp.]